MTRIAALVGALLGGLALSSPAGAFDFSGCGNFELLSRSSITFELGAATLIEGDVMVTDPAGFIKVGNKNKLKGSAFANKIIVGEGSTVAVCVANVVEGAGTCLATITPFVAPPGCTIQPFPPGVVVPQVPAVCSPGTPVIVAADTTLAPGCYASIKVLKNQTLTLEAGELYAVKGEFRTGLNAIVKSDTPGSRARLVSAGQVITAENIRWQDLFVFQTGAANGEFQIFNNAVLNNVLAVSTARDIHVHTGTTILGESALAAPGLDVEPISTFFSPPPPILCACPPGTHFAGETGRECVLD